METRRQHHGTASPCEPADVGAAESQRRRVLVIDDSARVRQQVRRMLEDAGFAVLEAENAAVAAPLLRAGGFALVLCDVQMPGQNGVELLEALQTEDQALQMPVIMLTSEGQPSLLKRAARAGARGWIIKPFKAQQLLATAARLLD